MISKEKLRFYKETLLESPRAKKIQKVLNRVFLIAIIGIIIYQLFDIGWGEVLKNLPTQPLFYIIFFFLYLSLPLVEVFIYRQIWPVKKWKLFKAFLTKRVYNDEVMGYSGEFFLFIWARKYLDDGDKNILKNVRDNNILSALSSNLVSFVLVGILVFTGILDLEKLVGNVDLIYIITAVVIVIAATVLTVQFRKYIFDLPLKKALVIFLLYISRFIIHNGLLIVQWAVVIPDTPLTVWLMFVAVMIVVNRIPFLPSRDLFFMWAGIELSRMLNMATASVAGMLLVYSALKKICNLILFLLISYYSKDPEIEEFKRESALRAAESNAKEIES